MADRCGNLAPDPSSARSRLPVSSFACPEKWGACFDKSCHSLAAVARTSINYRRVLPAIAGSFLCLVLVVGCASERNYHPLPPGEGPPVPQIVQLHETVSISTVHFPAGSYSLHAEDDAGYYYRSQRKVIKHAFSGLEQYDGGIFVPKGSSRPRVRGYLVWAGGRTKIGKLSPDDYDFR